MSGRTALVVGGAGGLGSAASRLLTAEGTQVVIADLETSRGRDLAEELGARFVAVDLLAIPEALRRLRAALPSIDGIVNAAGIAPEHATGNVALKAWERVLCINLTAPFFISQALADRIVRGGAIVNVSSIEAQTALATSGVTTPAYAASKAGLEAVTRCMATDLRLRGIRVNAVAPGFMRTAMTAGHESRHGDWITRRTPLGRWADPADVAGVVLFLLSDEARYMTGTTVVVDGGLTSTLLRPQATDRKEEER